MNGRFIAAGVFGARAASTITLQVLDSRGRVIYSAVVREREIGESYLSGGTITDRSQRSVSLDCPSADPGRYVPRAADADVRG